MICNKNNVNYEIIVNLINNIFLNADKDIRNDIFNKYKITTRNTKLSFTPLNILNGTIIRLF